jgi:cytochrome c553
LYQHTITCHDGSALFNPNKKAGENLTLCKPCHEHEQEMIGEKGTNDIPELLALYSPSERLDKE